MVAPAVVTTPLTYLSEEAIFAVAMNFHGPLCFDPKISAVASTVTDQCDTCSSE